MTRSAPLFLAVALATPLATHAARSTAAPAPAASGTTENAATDARAPALPRVTVHRDPGCGCCTGWVEHLRRHGFTVDVQQTRDLAAVRARLGVPAQKASCHTAEVGGLVVEGHVPAQDIRRLLAAPGTARGLVLPGMPLGSPGMEVPDGRVQRYVVERLDAGGATTPFATHGPVEAR